MSDLNQLIPKSSLITKTAEEGRQLAVKLSKLVLLRENENTDINEKLNSAYQQDAALLIAMGQNIAIEFQTIAQANDYWKRF